MTVDVRWAVGVAALIFGAGVAWATLTWRVAALEKTEQFYHGEFQPEWARPTGAK